MDALSDLHDSHAAVVRAYVARRSDAQTADEVCAEVWAVVWRRLGDVPDDPLPRRPAGALTRSDAFGCVAPASRPKRERSLRLKRRSMGGWAGD